MTVEASSSGAEAVRCPKCGTAQRGERACRSCGLAADKMATYASVRDAAIPPPVLAAWQRVEDDWSAEAAHDELWNLVAASGCFGWAAGRYRQVALERPDDAIAARRLATIRRAAEAALVASAAVKRETRSPYRSTTGVLVLLVVMMVIGLVYAVVRGKLATGEATPSPPDNAVEVR